MENPTEKQTKQEIINAFQELLKDESYVNEKETIRNFRITYKELTVEEEKEQRAAFDAKEEKEEDDRFEFVKNDLDHRFIELVNIYKDKVQADKEKVAAQEKQNFADKTALLEQLKLVVESGMQNVGEAFKQFYDIQEKWNKVGAVNKSKFKQLQFDYSHYRDLFYHNVNIHHQLKDYDFRKNGEQKQAIAAELKALVNQDSIKKMEREIKDLQSKWDSIGPTTNEQWESLKNDYWDAVNAIYDKIKTHYQAIRDAQAKALEEKTTLIESMKALFEDTATFKSPKQWAGLTDKVNELHKQWKAVGFSGKTKENSVWDEFKGLTDELRLKANTFFDGLKEQNKKAEEAKKQLIEKAEALKTSTDWKETSKVLIDLQKKWKNTGRAEYKVDQKLWEKFRAACDSFFNAKQEFFDTMDDRQSDHLNQKDELTAKISTSKNVEELKTLIGEWQSVGFVPKNKIAESEKVFNKAIEEAAKNLNIAADDLNKLKFEAKIAAIKDDVNAEAKMKSEKQFVQTQIDTLKEEIIRFEENMSFFGHSKGSQKLKEVVEKRVKDAELKLADWQEKLKMLRF